MNTEQQKEKDDARIPQMHFDFCDWRDAFNTWYENLALGYDMQMVISTHPYTSGYWIEYNGAGVSKGDYVYRGEKVLELEARIIHEHTMAAKEERGIKGLIL